MEESYRVYFLWIWDWSDTLDARYIWYNVGYNSLFFLSRFSLLVYCIIALVLFIFGVIICDITNRHFGTSDHPAAVWDEVVGFLFVMIAIPKIWYFILIGFVLFRVFDIWKPWPIKWLEKNIGGGLGVMIDDIIAALYAWIILITIINVLSIYQWSSGIRNSC